MCGSPRHLATRRARARARHVPRRAVRALASVLDAVPLPPRTRGRSRGRRSALEIALVDERRFWIVALVAAVVLRALRATRDAETARDADGRGGARRGGRDVGRERGVSDGQRAVLRSGEHARAGTEPAGDAGGGSASENRQSGGGAERVGEKLVRDARKLLRVIQRFILEEQDTICRVSARDSGKPLVDAAFGEVLVTLEKIRWLCNEGERWLKPEKRSSGAMMFYKKARVEYHPVGVMGAIVPWNYPFHNVFNPLVANLFAGNALVVKVSEYASWSSQYYGRVIDAALDAVGAPRDLVQIITGYGEAGSALVTGGVQKVVFVGSTGIGRKVMEAAAKTLTPVVLELGGKDPFIVCADADLKQCVPMALRGAFQSCGQNCAGAERFYVHEKIHDKFLAKVLESAKKLRQGWALSSSVDCGAMCMPKQAQYVQSLIDDAVARGADRPRRG